MLKESPCRSLEVVPREVLDNACWDPGASFRVFVSPSSKLLDIHRSRYSSYPELAREKFGWIGLFGALEKNDECGLFSIGSTEWRMMILTDGRVEKIEAVVVGPPKFFTWPTGASDL